MSESLAREFAELAAGQGDETQAALLVNQWLLPELDRSGLRQGLDELANQLPPGTPAWQLLLSMGFRGIEPGPQASRMDWVLAQRRGLPITLAVLLIHIARHHGQRVAGINFPGHFLVRIESDLIDPVRMQVTSEQSWLDRLTEAPISAQPFAQAGPLMIAQRMLNNLKISAYHEHRADQVLGALDMQLAMSPKDPGLWLEQAECWRGLGSNSSARSAYEKALPLIKDPELVQRITGHMAGLSKRPDILH